MSALHVKHVAKANSSNIALDARAGMIISVLSSRAVFRVSSLASGASKERKHAACVKQGLEIPNRVKKLASNHTVLHQHTQIILF